MTKKVEVPEAINEFRTKEWNEAISSRAASLRSWFSGAEWKEGIKAYLGHVLLERRAHLESKDNDPRDDQFIKGQIAMLKQIMSIPDVIEKQLALAEENQKKADSRGDAGY